MISEAIQTKCVTVIANSFSEIADEENTPFCIHSESETPLLLKEGLDGYSYEVEIFIVDTSPDSVKTKSVSMITAIEALKGTTTNGTKIDMVNYEDDKPGFDVESRLYGNLLRFTIETSNR